VSAVTKPRELTDEEAAFLRRCLRGGVWVSTVYLRGNGATFERLVLRGLVEVRDGLIVPTARGASR
jgi:hypothetical protein